MATLPDDTAAPGAPPASARVPILDALRGLAALSVCLYHFTYGNPDPNPDPWITKVGSFGRHGVDAFFVVSGFVIPFALEQGGYRLRDFWRFLAKRIIRIDPPLFLSMFVALHDSRTVPTRPDLDSVRFTVNVVAHDARFREVDAADSLTLWERRTD